MKNNKDATPGFFDILPDYNIFYLLISFTQGIIFKFGEVLGHTNWCLGFSSGSCSQITSERKELYIMLGIYPVSAACQESTIFAIWSIGNWTLSYTKLWRLTLCLNFPELRDTHVLVNITFGHVYEVFFLKICICICRINREDCSQHSRWVLSNLLKAQ